jgi:hypothetical protein
MMSSLPCRLISLQFSQMRLTDERTFTTDLSFVRTSRTERNKRPVGREKSPVHERKNILRRFGPATRGEAEGWGAPTDSGTPLSPRLRGERGVGGEGNSEPAESSCHGWRCDRCDRRQSLAQLLSALREAAHQPEAISFLTSTPVIFRCRLRASDRTAFFALLRGRGRGAGWRPSLRSSNDARQRAIRSSQSDRRRRTRRTARALARPWASRPLLHR